ncbi:MAG: RHS repeat-associated core domain-containing protein [Pyrinomonadaceae bacterium]
MAPPTSSAGPIPTNSHPVRKQFTGYERDIESDLDFAQARYYSSKLGRFYSVDPENAGAIEDDPQSWNGCAYSRNNPVLFTDPDGLEYKVCNSEGQCWTHDDGDFKKGQKGFSGLYEETDRDGHYDSGIIKDGDGNQVGTYERTSIDRDYQFIYGVSEQSVRKAKVVGALAGGAVVVGACIALCPAAATAAAATMATRAGATSALSQVSKGNLKHISKHLPNFLKMDASMTLEKVVAVGLEITKIGTLVGTPGGRKVFEATVNIGGRPTTVRAVLNTEGTLRSVHIRK